MYSGPLVVAWLAHLLSFFHFRGARSTFRVVGVTDLEMPRARAAVIRDRGVWVCTVVVGV